MLLFILLKESSFFWVSIIFEISLSENSKKNNILYWSLLSILNGVYEKLSVKLSFMFLVIFENINKWRLYEYPFCILTIKLIRIWGKNVRSHISSCLFINWKIDKNSYVSLLE